MTPCRILIICALPGCVFQACSGDVGGTPESPLIEGGALGEGSRADAPTDRSLTDSPKDASTTTPTDGPMTDSSSPPDNGAFEQGSPAEAAADPSLTDSPPDRLIATPADAGSTDSPSPPDDGALEPKAGTEASLTDSPTDVSITAPADHASTDSPSELDGGRDAADAQIRNDGGFSNGPLCVPVGSICAPGEFLHSRGVCVGPEVDIGCSAGGQPCALPHAEATCAGGRCAIIACRVGWGDCNGSAEDGCETSLANSLNCRQCGTACQTGEVCGDSGCQVGCAPPQTNCAGACVSLIQDPQHCGGCSGLCNDPNHATVTCTVGSCGARCLPGFTMCGQSCVDTNFDRLNCGECGKVCSALCIDGACVCPRGSLECHAQCVDVEANVANCGGCDVVCGEGQGCLHGRCVAAPLTDHLCPATSPGDLAADAFAVYWTEPTAGRIMVANKLSGASSILATAQLQPWRIAVDDTYVYWTERLGGAVRRIRKAGGATEFVAGASEPWGIAVDNARVYWTNHAGSIANILKTDVNAAGGPVTMATVIGPEELSLDDTQLYVTSLQESPPASGLLYRIDKQTVDGEATLIGSSTWRMAASVDCNYVYHSFSTHNNLKTINRIPKQGGTYLEWFTFEWVSSIVTPGDFVYVVANGQLRRLDWWDDAVSGVVTSIAWTDLASTSTAQRMIVDGDLIYWTDSNFIGQARR